MAEPQTLFDKIWAAHAIQRRADGATLLHIDRHLVHDGSRNAFRMLADRNLPVRRPDRTFATPDHYVATSGRGLSAINKPHRRVMVEDLEANARAKVAICRYTCDQADTWSMCYASAVECDALGAVSGVVADVHARTA